MTLIDARTRYCARPLKENYGGLKPGDELTVCDCGNVCVQRPELEAKAYEAFPFSHIEFRCTPCVLKKAAEQECTVTDRNL
jgi:hypothetical protein